MTLTQEQIAHVRSLESADGTITPDVVVADARRKDSPLHSLFEWDKSKAAAMHWIQQAREVIGAVVYLRNHETRTIKVPVYVRDPEAVGQGYTSTVALRSDETRAREALVMTLKTAAGHLRRAMDIAEDLGLVNEVDELITRITGLERRLATEVAA